MRLNVDMGPNAVAGINLTAAISPDGRRIVFPVRDAAGKQLLATRLLDQANSTVLAGTEDGSDAFFSPDGEWVGFFTDTKLKKVSVRGGSPVVICDANRHYGATWGADDNIIGALQVLAGLSRVSAGGGQPQPLTQLEKGEVTHRWPQFVPEAQAVLFTASPSPAGMEAASIRALSLQTGAVKTLITRAHFGRYLPSNGERGHLVFLRQGVLFAAPFDPVRLELEGTPAPILEDVAANATIGGGQLDFSRTGTLVYLAGKGAGQTWPVVWLDSSGKMEPLISTPGAYLMPSFSPDGRHLALTINTGTGSDIYAYDLQRETMTRLTFGGHAQGSIWSPDGKYIASGSGSGILLIRSDGSVEPQRLLEAQGNAVPRSFSPDGRHLAYSEAGARTGFDIWTLPLDNTDPAKIRPGPPESFLRTPADELTPSFSPDGRWIAYRSNESGIQEIYVRPFPARPGGKWQISTEGGVHPIWSHSGRELFYETLDSRIMAVDYTVNGDSFVPGKPRLWSDRQILFTGSSNLTLAPDGKRFAVFPPPEISKGRNEAVRVTFLLNFFDELRRRSGAQNNPAAKIGSARPTAQPGCLSGIGSCRSRSSSL
jgi:Periplasmic component of the Tol biopolymer transport system